VLAVEAVIGQLGLTSMGGIVGSVEIQHHVHWRCSTLSLLEIHADQGFAGVAIDGVVQA
jgi:hypothetical protein